MKEKKEKKGCCRDLYCLGRVQLANIANLPIKLG